MRGSRKFCQRGSNSDNVLFLFFSFFFRGERLQRPPKAGNYRPASKTPFQWRFAGGPIVAHGGMLTWQLCDFQGIRTSITRKPYKFVIFRGGGGGSGPPVPTSGSAHAGDISSMCGTLASMTSRRQIQDGGPHDVRSKMAGPTTPRWRPPRNQDGGPCDAFGYTSEGESTT